MKKKKQLKFEFASTNVVDKYSRQIRIILKLIGHPEALVTDESRLIDFTDIFDSKKDRENVAKKLSGRLGIEVKLDDLLIEIAKKVVEYDA